MFKVSYNVKLLCKHALDLCLEWEWSVRSLVWVWSPLSLRSGVSLQLEWWSWHVDMTACVDVGLTAAVLSGKQSCWLNASDISRPTQLLFSAVSLCWSCWRHCPACLAVTLGSWCPVFPRQSTPAAPWEQQLNNWTKIINISLFSSQEYEYCESSCNFGQKVISLTNSDNTM